jgi:signal transduction histidine kinase
MKVTPALKEELADWLDNYWTTYLKGDIETWATFIRDDYRNIGGTKEEIWNSKQEIINYTNSILDQMLGTVDIRNRKVELIPYGEYMMVHEFTDLYVKVEGEWIFYGPFRMSSLLEKTNTGWIALHQHGSYPDMKAMEGEAFSIDALKAENAKLQAAVKSRTLELEQNNRELEIEAATERVRVQSMAMQHPDDLDKVNKEILNQLNQLQIPGLTGVTFYLINENGWVNAWDFSSPGNIGAPNSYTLQFDSNKYEMMGEPFRVFGQSDLDYFVADYSFEKLQKAANELEEINTAVAAVLKDALANGKLTHQWSTCARISNGLLGIDLVSPPSEDTKTIVLKMAGAFNQAYQRFLDLQKAEAQAREAKIEAALEKVRSRSLAMHKSDELNDVVKVLFEKMIELQVPSTAVGIQTFTEGSKDSQVFVCGDVGTGLIVNQYRLPYFDHPIIRDYFNVHKEKPDYFVGNYPKKEIDSFYDVVLKLPELKDLPTEVKTMILQSDFYEVTMVPGEKSLLAVNDFIGNPLSESHVNILKRFAKVFDQTYTRFLDLQKAEAQAREATIETTLERVRSRSLAMHNSNELKDVIILVLKNLGELGIDMKNRAAGIFTFEQESKDYYQWAASAEYTSVISFLTPYIDHPVQNDIWNARKTGTEFYAKSYTVEEKNTLFQYFFDLPALKSMPEEDKKRALGFKYYDVAIAFGKNSGLTLVSHSGVLLTADENGILKRLAKVFEQAYIRFLDLQKAEAQAREAQIEAALERVRSRTMAMQRSDELLDVASILFQQVKALGVPQWNCGFNIWNPGDKEFTYYPGAPDGVISPSPCKIPLTEHPVFMRFDESRKKGEELLIYEKQGEEQEDHYRYMLSLPGVGDLLRSMLDAGFTLPTFQIDHVANFAYGNLIFITFEHFPQMHDVFKRFAKVFEQTYTRFLDLQKAEAQAKEAQIETALERVRSRSMGMQKSEELKEVIKIIYQQLKHLNIHLDHAGFVVDYKPKGDWHFWIADEQDIPSKITHPYFESVWATQFNSAKEKGEDLFVTYLNFEEKNKFYNELLSYIPDLPQASKDFYLNCPGLAASTALLENVGLYIENFSGTPYTEEENNTLMRFGKVFQQTYTRFLDLQKAEVQAREAKIEAALEKARARTMAMQSSDELPEVANVLFLEVQGLGIPAWSCGYNILAEDKTVATCCMSSEGTLQTPFKLRLFGEASFAEMGDFIRSEQTMLVQELGGKALEEHYAYMKSFPDLKSTFDQIDELGLSLPTYQINHLCKFTQGFLLFITYEKVPDSHDIFKRFTKVFEQTYTRFLDLQKAEAQAREAQIELALERVRARAMSMQHSDHLKDVIEVIGLQLHEMGLFFDYVNFIVGDTTDGLDTWNVSFGQANPVQFFIPRTDNRVFNETMQARKDGLEFIAYTLTEEETFHFVTHLVTNSILKYLPEEAIQKRLQAKGMSVSTVVLNELFLTMANYSAIPYTDEENSILKRFGNAFQQAFTRFLDLQKAEAQTREAQINLAVERVRARALAMFQSEEILHVVNKLREEIMSLDIPNVIAATIHLKENDGRCRIWDITSIEINDEALQHPMDIRFKLEDTDPNFFMRRIWGNTANYFVEMQDEDDFKRTIQWLRDIDRNQQADETVQFIEATKIKKLYHPTVQLNSGRMGIDLLEEPAPEIESILEKMGAAFDLAYTRFLDLQKAETQARQAKIETALEKVRARALAMQQPEELIEVAEVLRHEMGLLGVEELETCSIFIHDKTINRTECWYALKDFKLEGKKLVSDHFPLQLHDTWVGREMEKFYRSDSKQVSIVMQGTNRKEWINYCEEKSISLQGYYGETIPDRTYHLYKFSHGAIGAASAGDISSESWDLLQRAASVFSLAYSRFKDLTQARFDLHRLKEEKQKAETALSELQTTQKQLIQSEKMASLGELTAGIAHEIQNPLNFVNNFSEVSKEMLDEMREAIEKGDTEEAKEIMQDVIQNLEKINHHGKRADGIVKGMLQHSRTSSGAKEPTDINALADEYLRLAYHGLRAKDKTFNATLKTDFDESIGNINIIPQDIGRVILNLITNAFYVVNEKSKQNIDGYEPTVSVSTKKMGDKVEIKVADNGNGIPLKVLDKIFQPFFTTKPTGQGTGLGLSLSYDIVKVHGGELKVETREGEGSEFIIQLPF